MSFFVSFIFCYRCYFLFIVLELDDQASVAAMASISDVIPTMNQKGHLTLHNSDSPGAAMLVRVPLTGENYMTWSRLMLIALRAKNKVGFVTGKHKKPE